MLALAAAAMLAFAIASGTAQAAGSDVAIEPAGAGDVNQVLVSDSITYTATSNPGWTFDHWVVEPGEGGSYTSTENPYTRDRSTRVTKAVFRSSKQDWTGTKTIEASALYGETDAVGISGYLPTDAGTVEIPEDSVSVSDPDGVLESWSFNNVDGTVTYTFVNDPSKAGKKATISATVTSDKYNDYTGSVVLTVLGKVPTTYKVSVSADPTAGGTASADKQEAAAGDTVKLTATPADRSWEFVEWKTETEGVTIKDDLFTMPSSDVAVTAVFKQKEAPAPAVTKTITFDANGGTGTMDALTNTEGSTVTLTANAFKRNGYTFTGWNTAKDGSGTAYKDKAEVKLDSDMTLYAQWKANSNKTTKTGDTLMPIALATLVAVIAVGILFAVRRRVD